MEDNKELLQKIFSWGDGYGYILLNSEMCELIDIFKPYIEQVEKEAYERGRKEPLLEGSPYIEEKMKEAREEQDVKTRLIIARDILEAKDEIRKDERLKVLRGLRSSSGSMFMPSNSFLLYLDSLIFELEKENGNIKQIAV
jgi:hypothetical protein